MPTSYDLIVIGGGLVGGAIAWGAAARGASVALLDEGDIAFRAARGNFGLVWVQGKGVGKPAYALWSMASSRLWPAFSEELNRRTGIDSPTIGARSRLPSPAAMSSLPARNDSPPHRTLKLCGAASIAETLRFGQ